MESRKSDRKTRSKLPKKFEDFEVAAKDLENICEEKTEEFSEGKSSVKGSRNTSTKSSTTSSRRQRVYEAEMEALNKLAELEIEQAKKEAEAKAKAAKAEAEAEVRRLEIQTKRRLIIESRKLQLSLLGSTSGRSGTSQASLQNVEDNQDQFNATGRVRDWLENIKETRRSEVHGLQDKLKTSDQANIIDSSYKNKCILRSKHEPAISCCKQSFCKDLPPFNGDVEQWPVWIEEYTRSSEIYGFSDLDNLQRLQRSLKDKARVVVQSLLIYPENVNEIIELLRRRFGRPDYIIDTLINKIHNAPYQKEYRTECLIEFSDMVRNLVVTVKSLQYYHYLQNPQLMKELVSKLSASMKLSWGQFANKISPGVVGLQDFSVWLSEMAEAAAFVTPLSHDIKAGGKARGESNFTLTSYNNKVINDKDRSDKGLPSNNTYKCLICKLNCKKWEDCKYFLDASADERWKLVTNFKRCFSCLKPFHQVRQCQAKEICNKEGCTRKHHKLLHSDKKYFKNVDKPEIVGHQFENKQHLKILLRVLPVTVIGRDGNEVKSFALLDEASTVTLIDDNLAKKLNLEGQNVPINLMWTNDQTHSDKQSRSVNLKLKGCDNKIFKINNARTISNLKLPVQSINAKYLKSKWKHLIDIPFMTFNDVRPLILLGQDNIDLTIAREVIQGPKNSPLASRCKLGWVIHGPSSNYMVKGRTDKDFSLFIQEDKDYEIDNLIKEMFEFDFPDHKSNDNDKRHTEEDERAVQIMQETCTQTENKQWEIGLLWKDKITKLPPSKMIALKRLKFVENKMDANPTLCDHYCEQVDRYLKKGYARVLTKDEIKVPHDKDWYLPHFPVTNPRKPDKFRFVFDAASKSNGQSLNDCLMTGPDLLNSLVDILFKFRENKIAFAADIEEMFLRIKIQKQDQWAQTFLWRGRERNVPPKEMIMQVMIFGAVCSPALAIYVTKRNAEKFVSQYPEAVNAINKQLYMDDYVDSKQTVTEAVKIAHEVIDIFAEGGFNLRNFISNSKEFMNQIPPEKHSKNFDPIYLSKKSTERVLGLSWDYRNDQFTYNSSLLKQKDSWVHSEETPTKRQVLVVVMSVFDPLGFLSPLTMMGRMLMQEIWKLKIRWDEQISPELLRKWKAFVKELDNIKTLTIPRCYSLTNVPLKSVQLHTFCDASSRGYAAVSYLRFENTQGQTELAFVYAKSRVASLKPVTVPRLELQAAVLGARLGFLLQKGHTRDIDKRIFWTDSKVTWYRINTDNTKYQQYVTRRIREIHELTMKEEWRWLPTNENVADEATRDIGQNKIHSESRWIRGPEFLKLTEDCWPKTTEESPDIQDTEIKIEAVLLVDDIKFSIDFDRFSKFDRLIRTIGWVFRFINNINKKRNKIIVEYLTVDELKIAERECIKTAQRECFADDINNLMKGRNLSKLSHIYNFSPVIDQGLLCVKGRTINSPNLEHSAKYPIILDSKHRFTKLLIHHCHIEVAHQGQETVVNTLRQNYWITHIRSAVRKCWRACTICQKRKAKPQVPPEMAPLPACRVSKYTRPFTCIGLDYFGPTEVKIGRRREKRYVALFTCLSIRAVHLELVSSLSTDGAIMAIRRMAARRGYPSEIYSDNGSNLRGAEKELKKRVQDLDHNLLGQFCAAKGVKWCFNPPMAPHMGGSWERMVRSVKTSMYAILKEQAPAEETLRTILCEVENILNSRPLTFVSLDLNDPESLTPNHFLIGSTNSLPSLDTGNALRRQWRIAQQFSDQFWKRWVKEYLPSINNRKKWFEDTKGLRTEDIVLIVDENHPRNVWLLGRIVKLHTGNDGKVRSAEVKTKSGTYKRPVVKLIKINLDQTFI